MAPYIKKWKWNQIPKLCNKAEHIELLFQRQLKIDIAIAKLKAKWWREKLIAMFEYWKTVLDLAIEWNPMAIEKINTRFHDIIKYPQKVIDPKTNQVYLIQWIDLDSLNYFWGQYEYKHKRTTLVNLQQFIRNNCWYRKFTINSLS